MADAGDVTAKKMFGEYALYLQGKIIALFCDDQLFIKPTDAGRALLGKVKEAAPYPGAKPWFLISGDRCEDGELLSELARTTAKALPAPKLKAPKKAKKQPSKKAARATNKTAAKKKAAKSAKSSRA